MILQKWCQPQFRVTITCRNINVIDTSVQDHRQHCISFVLPHGTKGGCTEQDPGTFVTRSAKWDLLNHRCLLIQCSIRLPENWDVYRLTTS
jgi:hypothetical protein